MIILVEMVIIRGILSKIKIGMFIFSWRVTDRQIELNFLKKHNIPNYYGYVAMCCDLFVGNVPISVLPILCPECLASPRKCRFGKTTRIVPLK